MPPEPGLRVDERRGETVVRAGDPVHVRSEQGA
jgi:hypothetical protein